MKAETNRKELVTRNILYVFFLLLAVICFLPFYFMMINATHTSADIAQKLSFLPGGSLLDNYNRMQTLINIWRGFVNSLIISVSSVILSGYFGALTAYGFAKFKIKGKNILFGIVLGSLIIPSQLAIVGLFDVIVKLHLIDNLAALVIPSIASASIVFFVRYYIESAVPDSVLDSARIDGCGEFMIFNRIILPMIIPSIATMSIFTFINSWNSYLIPLFVLNSQDKFTVPLLAVQAKGVYQNDYGAVYTTIFMSMVPILVMFAFCSRYIISGLTTGAVKE